LPRSRCTEWSSWACWPGAGNAGASGMTTPNPKERSSPGNKAQR
jgi:hypothetical protein